MRTTITLTSEARPVTSKLTDAYRGLHQHTVEDLTATILAPTTSGEPDLLDRYADRLAYLPV